MLVYVEPAIDLVAGVTAGPALARGRGIASLPDGVGSFFGVGEGLSRGCEGLSLGGVGESRGGEGLSRGGRA